MNYRGSCHCGRIAFDVEGEIFIRHHFCATCGIHPFAEAKDRAGRSTAAVNLRCLEGIDLEAIPVEHFDGRAL